jgi:hypothetical protein
MDMIFRMAWFTSTEERSHYHEKCALRRRMREEKVLTMAGLGAHLRQTSASRKVAR